ncbi:MAG: hypothetical protein JRJ85_10345 [Deltaproteobacteria bacterium]|nr:hypothetical protein [Deltaproteobacteria bacterium]
MNDHVRKKTYLSIITCVVFLFLLSACGRGVERQGHYLPHIGSWEGVDSKGIKATMVLRENGIGKITFHDKIIEFKYVFDYSKNPLWMDIIHDRADKPYRERLIAKFEDKNHWKWRTFYTEERPSEFSQEDTNFTAVFTRVGTFETI